MAGRTDGWAASVELLRKGGKKKGAYDFSHDFFFPGLHWNGLHCTARNALQLHCRVCPFFFLFLSFLFFPTQRRLVGRLRQADDKPTLKLTAKHTYLGTYRLSRLAPGLVWSGLVWSRGCCIPTARAIVFLWGRGGGGGEEKRAALHLTCASRLHDISLPLYYAVLVACMSYLPEILTIRTTAAQPRPERVCYVHTRERERERERERRGRMALLINDHCNLWLIRRMVYYVQ